MAVQNLNVTLRAAQIRDYPAVREVNCAAFGQENEAALVDALRQRPEHIPELSLVAEYAGRVVGHILFSRASIESEGGPVAALALAPMAVWPEFQRRGIGSALVRAGLEECGRLGHGLVIVLGHAELYPRFGFVPAPPLGIRAPFPVPDQFFMVTELIAGSLAGVRGTVRYLPPFANV